MALKFLFVGDVVGKPGRLIVKALLSRIVNEHAVDFVIANAENAAGGSGITVKLAEELFSYGINLITMGDHVYRKKEIIPYLETSSRMLRPANFPTSASGKGYVIQEVRGSQAAFVNLLGRIFMHPVDSPFAKIDEILACLPKDVKVIIVDFHAEATSEKIAMGWYLDGKVSAVLGTHTHVQTADERILPQGTAYITDAGMTGPFDSIIGRKKEKVLHTLTTHMPTSFDVAKEDVRLSGVVVEIDENTGKASSIERVQYKGNDYEYENAF